MNTDTAREAFERFRSELAGVSEDTDYWIEPLPGVDMHLDFGNPRCGVRLESVGLGSVEATVCGSRFLNGTDVNRSAFVSLDHAVEMFQAHARWHVERNNRCNAIWDADRQGWQCSFEQRIVVPIVCPLEVRAFARNVIEPWVNETRDLRKVLNVLSGWVQPDGRACAPGHPSTGSAWLKDEGASAQVFLRQRA